MGAGGWVLNRNRVLDGIGSQCKLTQAIGLYTHTAVEESTVDNVDAFAICYQPADGRATSCTQRCRRWVAVGLGIVPKLHGTHWLPWEYSDVKKGNPVAFSYFLVVWFYINSYH